MYQRNTVYKYKLQRKPVMLQIQIGTYFHLSLILMLKNTAFVHVELKLHIKNF